ncbi:hypothetical protein JTE90_015032 [Oedothorax gibbosus]|uniref:Uncharacterized protein n=1 Tax=Oedothorax gibbosus TaxID=931172 RepID=A0AAV6TWR9_9ARAC|nr:hypothetical protein JTE90_015032 [Oedothorax gibbosus]
MSIYLTDADQELYKNFPVVISERKMKFDDEKVFCKEAEVGLTNACAQALKNRHARHRWVPTCEHGRLKSIGTSKWLKSRAKFTGASHDIAARRVGPMPGASSSSHK